MNRIDTSHASEGQPFLAPLSLDLVQDAARDITALQAIALVGPDYDDNKAYIVWGVDQTLPGGLPTFTEGCILYGRELYYVAPHNIPSITVFEVPVLAQSITYPAGDPTLFASGANYSIHEIRRMVFVAGATGSGISDYDACLRVLRPVSHTNVPHPSSINGQTVDFTRNESKHFTLTSAATTITIDVTNARPGCEVILASDIGGGGAGTYTLSFTYAGTVTMLTPASIVLAAGPAKLIVRLKFVGNGVIYGEMFVQ
jgi:hypothetical protein